MHPDSAITSYLQGHSCSVLSHTNSPPLTGTVTLHSLSNPMQKQSTNNTFSAQPLQDNMQSHSLQTDNYSINYESINSTPLHSLARLLADCSNCVTLTDQNNSLMHENRTLRNDLYHLRMKYKKAMKGKVLFYRTEHVACI